MCRKFNDIEFDIFAEKICEYMEKINYFCADNKKNDELNFKNNIKKIFDSVKYKDAEDLIKYSEDPIKLLNDPPVWFLYHNIYNLCIKNGNLGFLDKFIFYLNVYKYTEHDQTYELINLLMSVINLDRKKKYILFEQNFYLVLKETKCYYLCKKIQKKFIYNDFQDNNYYFHFDDENKINHTKNRFSIIHAPIYLSDIFISCFGSP